MICFGMSSNATGSSRSIFSVLANMWAVPWFSVNPITLMNKNRGLMGVNMGQMWGEKERVAGWLQEILRLTDEGVIRPQVHATVPFSNAKEAHRILHDRENFGKVLLVPDEKYSA